MNMPAKLPQKQADAKYIIAWDNPTALKSGRGKHLLSLAEANELAKELNEDYPHIKHTVEKA